MARPREESTHRTARGRGDGHAPRDRRRFQRLVFAAEQVAADEAAADLDMAAAFAADEAAFRPAARSSGVDPDAGFDGD